MTDTARSPLTKTARHALIVELVESQPIRSQAELADLLIEHGVQVTQGTLSRDLVDLGATRARDSAGHLFYVVPGEGGARSPVVGDYAGFEAKLARLCSEVLVSADGSANLVVLRTPPGAAQYFASAIDKVARRDVLGTIAGDDTVVVITREADGAPELAQWFLRLSSEPTESSH